jgi:hypothetical protein
MISGKATIPVSIRSQSMLGPVRGRLHGYESVYYSPYDFMHNLHASQIGRYPILHLTSRTMICLRTSAKIVQKLTYGGHLWLQIAHRIVRRLVRKIARVDGPLVLCGCLHARCDVRCGWIGQCDILRHSLFLFIVLCKRRQVWGDVYRVTGPIA